MIEKLIITSRTTEVDAVSKRIIESFKNSGLGSDANLSGIFSELEPYSQKLSAAIRQSKAESNLDEEDEKRDDEVRGLNYMLLGYLHNPDPAIRSAAEAVAKVFDKYGVSVTGESYASESSLVTSMLDDLSKSNLQEVIAAMPGCTEQIAALQTAQDEFEAARVAYDEQKAKEETRENATELKKAVAGIINDKLVVYLRAMMQVDEATYGDFGRTVDEIISENNEVVKRRRKKPVVTN
jgi:hypothetical protein